MFPFIVQHNSISVLNCSIEVSYRTKASQRALISYLVHLFYLKIETFLKMLVSRFLCLWKVLPSIGVIIKHFCVKRISVLGGNEEGVTCTNRFSVFVFFFSMITEWCLISIDLIWIIHSLLNANIKPSKLMQKLIDLFSPLQLHLKSVLIQIILILLCFLCCALCATYLSLLVNLCWCVLTVLIQVYFFC